MVLQLKQCHCSIQCRLDSHICSETPLQCLSVRLASLGFAKCEYLLAICMCRIETKGIVLSGERHPHCLWSLITSSVKKVSISGIYFSVVDLTNWCDLYRFWNFKQTAQRLLLISIPFDFTLTNAMYQILNELYLNFGVAKDL